MFLSWYEAAAAAATFMQWEYLDANTVRTYEIPIHIGPHGLENYPEFTLPPGFTPAQQFPYVSTVASSSQVRRLKYRHPLNFGVNVDIGDPANIKTAKILT